MVTNEYECADDLMHSVCSQLVASQERFAASKGSGTEVLGASFRLTNPRARLSRSEMRGKVYSALGELFWCLSGSNELSFIEHYLKDYKRSSDDGVTIHGAYGPRLFGAREHGQVENITRLLRAKPGSRRAVIQLFSSKDVVVDSSDIPCTCTLQALIRNERLHLIVHMRSNDAYLGLPHDLFVFTMLQELIARSLGIDVGFYHHFVGHLHLYDEHREKAEAFLGEGFQAIEPMPPMPMGDPFVVLPDLLTAERRIREDPSSPPVSSFSPYWEDILRLLRIFSECKHKREGYRERVANMKDKPRLSVYALY